MFKNENNEEIAKRLHAINQAKINHMDRVMQEMPDRTLRGAGFWDSFGRGFMSVIKPVAGVAKAVLPVVAPGVGTLASMGMDAVGLGKSGGKKRGRPKGKKQGAKDKEDEKLAMEIKALKDAIKGAGRSGGKKQSKKDKEDEKLGAEVKGLKNKIEDAFVEGKGKSGGRKVGGLKNTQAMKGSSFAGFGKSPLSDKLAGKGSSGGKKKRQVSESRRNQMKRRGEAIKRIMKEQGLKLGEASKYLKAHPEMMK